MDTDVYGMPRVSLVKLEKQQLTTLQVLPASQTPLPLDRLALFSGLRHLCSQWPNKLSGYKLREES